MKIALITGGSGGIGYELALQFAADGYQVVLVARNSQRLQQIASEITGKHKVPVHIIEMDLSELDAPQRLYEDVQVLGIQVDVLVNNAGFGVYGSYLETNGETELRMIDLNMRTLTDLTKRFLPDMVRRGTGGVLNVASTGAFQPGPLMSVYFATKAYVLSYTEALANELQGSGVTVSVLCPGMTKTEFFVAPAFSDQKQNVNMRRVERMMMDASDVAAIGYRGFKKGKRVIIPGFLNKVMAISSKISPRGMVLAISRKLMESMKS
jgi:short-subunit dehydrogenase